MKLWLSANREFIFGFLADLDTPRALTVKLLVKYGEWDQVATLSLDPRLYLDADSFARDLQATDLLRKAPLPTKLDRRANAIKAWEEAEDACFRSNEYFDQLWRIGEPKNALARKFCGLVKKLLGRWLGPLPSELEGGFGPGTCVEYEGRDPTVLDKVYLTPTTTPSCAALFRWHYDRTLWGADRWKNRLGAPGTSPGNRFTTVPKDGKTDRPISIEPVGNLWLQLGIGRYLKQRLRAVGLPPYSPEERELFPGYTWKRPDAQSVHRELLRTSSGWATIDLTSASDMLSRGLVQAVLPSDWFALLDDCRSHKTLINGTPRILEKFSSMGNGFTFELESLIFAALVQVACGLTAGRDLYVFGDDIIVPERCFDTACAALKWAGFVPNMKKSFGTGLFRESCGANVFDGRDVTPVRIKGPIEDPAALVALHNALFKQGFASRRTLALLRKRIPRRLQVAGPEHLGDVVLHGLPWAPHIHGDNNIRWVWGLSVKPEVEIPLERWSPELHMVALLLGSSTRLSRRNSRTVASLKRFSVS